MVFEVKYLKYTLFVLILPGSMKATRDMWGQPPSAVRRSQLDTPAGAVNLGNTPFVLANSTFLAYDTSVRCPNRT